MRYPAILPTHPKLWIHAAQPSSVSRGRRTTASPLMRADMRPYFIAAIIQTSTPSAAPAKIRHAEGPVSAAAGTALRSYYLWPSHACSRHELLASGRQHAHSVPPSHPQRNNEENPSRTRTAREDAMWSPLIFAQNLKLAKANVPNGKWSLSNYEGWRLHAPARPPAVCSCSGMNELVW
jgi:hypothetical protein